MRFTVFTAAISVLLAGITHAIQLDSNSTTSIVDAAKTVAGRIVDLYRNSSEIPGLLPQPFYFWEAGLTWDSLVNYWALTGDTTYNEIVAEALRFQLGDNLNYMPVNQTKTEGNDDQSFWALAAMTAAESGFPLQPSSGSNVTWVQIAENVFNEQVERWDDSSCGGGLRWQIFSFNNGYTYKNAISNGNFFQLASRLARFTGNQTYADWADKTFKWSVEVGLITFAPASDAPKYDNATILEAKVFDGTDSTTDCSIVNHIQWTSSLGTYLSGVAYAYNASLFPAYNNTLTGAFLTGAFTTFAQYGNRTVAPVEIACAAPSNPCNIDQLAFRAILARAYAQTKDLAFTPGTRAYNGLKLYIQYSAQVAAAQCSGGDSGTVCGSDWSNQTWDGTSGYGQQLSALNMILAALPGKALGNNTTAATASGPGNGTTTGNGDAASGTSSPVGGNGASSVEGLSASSLALMALVAGVVAFGL